MPRRTGSKITATAWQPFFGNIEGVLSSTSIFSVLAPDGLPGTILRTHGTILAEFDGVSDSDAAAIFWGLMVTDDDRVAAGAGAFPDIGTDIGDLFASGVLLLNAEAAARAESAVDRQVFDSKAMRKIKQDDQVVLVAQMIVLAGSGTVDLIIAGRTLIGS